MSISSEITRITNNVQNTIDIIEATGVTVPEGANSNNLPSLAAALANEKQDKVTGGEGEVAGFDSSGNLTALSELDASMLRGGMSTILSNKEAVSISPSFNGIGYAVYRGAQIKLSIDGTEIPLREAHRHYLFDGLTNTYLRFQSPDSYCEYGFIDWSDSREYAAGDFARQFESGTSGPFKYFRALQSNTGLTPSENADYWEDVSANSAFTTSNYIDITNMPVVIEVTNLKNSIGYENGVSLYWRTPVQFPDQTKIEYQINGVWTQVVNDTSVIGGVQQYYTGSLQETRATIRGIRLTFTNMKLKAWTALVQIAVTGIVGGIEGTLLNKGGGALYGTLSMNENKITDVGTPTEGTDAANKDYVDSISVSPKYSVVTLSASGWSDNAQTVTVSGVLADETAQLIQPVPAIASQSAYYAAGILCTGQAANSLTFTCTAVPTDSLTVYVVMQEVSA